MNSHSALSLFKDLSLSASGLFQLCTPAILRRQSHSCVLGCSADTDCSTHHSQSLWKSRISLKSSTKLYQNIPIMVQLETTYCTDYEIISQIHNEWENVAVQSKTDEITFEVSFDSDFWLIHRDNWSIIIATSPHNGSKEKPNGGMWVLVKVAPSVLRCSYATRVRECLCLSRGRFLMLQHFTLF